MGGGLKGEWMPRMLTCCRPLGIVAGLVNKKDQPAGEIVEEIVKEAHELLQNANKFVARL